MNNFNIELGSQEKVMVARVMIMAFAVIYAVCPDLLPGPVDDIVVALLGVYAQSRISVRETE